MSGEQIIEAAKAKANADCRAAVEQAEVALERSEEWVITGFENKPHHVLPQRQLAAGMLAHIKRSMERNGQ